MSKENERGENEENEKKQELELDLKRLTRTELKTKYASAYNSWRNRKSQTKGTPHWAPEFDDFADFLRLLGPPQPGQTLDREDNTNPMYAPGLVKWSSKREQANNRSTTRLANKDGIMLPATEVARALGVAPGTDRQRHHRSLSTEAAFEEFMAGVNERGLDPRTYRPWPRHRDELPAIWERAYEESGGIERGVTRYKFLIARLKNLIGEAQGDIDKLAEDGVDLKTADEEFGRLARSQAELRRAWREEPIWLNAVVRYEARLRAKAHQKQALKSADYLHYRDKDDEF